jgi:hypothetical protein
MTANSRKTIDRIECLILSYENLRRPPQKVQKKLEPAMDTIHYHLDKLKNADMIT